MASTNWLPNGRPTTFFKHEPNAMECLLPLAFLAYNIFHAFWALSLKPQVKRAGGRRKGRGVGRPLSGDKTKVPIIGIVERKTPERSGRVVARVSRDVKKQTLQGMVREYVLPKSTVYTDEFPAYGNISTMRDENNKDLGYRHRRIDHSEGVYVTSAFGDSIHTNTIEGFWSLIKRGLGGTHHAVSAKFLQTYLDEYSFRYNRRDVPRPMFKQILERVSEMAE